jgi:hypothetical protein
MLDCTIIKLKKVLNRRVSLIICIINVTVRVQYRLHYCLITDTEIKYYNITSLLHYVNI